MTVPPFCSIYTKSYRPFEKDSELETAKPCLYFSDLGENFLPLEDSKEIYNAERDEALLKETALKRLITTYQKSYCLSQGKKSMIIDPDDLDADQFVNYFNNYYKKRTQPLPPPLLTARRVNGCSRFEDYYTGLTTYQDTIGRVAYEYFKREYDAGKSRLFYKKQLALRRQREEEVPKQEKTEGEEKGEGEGVQHETSETKEKICALCCEKFGDFSEGVRQQESEPLTARKEKKNSMLRMELVEGGGGGENWKKTWKFCFTE